MNSRAATGPHVSDLFEARASATPDALAVTCGGTELSYADLELRANRLAWLLIRHGAGPGRLVAVLLDRSPDLIVALLAVLKSGAGYVPIAPEDPAQRVEYVLSDSGACVLLTSGRAAQDAALDDNVRAVIRLDAPQTAGLLESCPATAPTDADRSAPTDPRDLAYVIYTSGSTGRPKGVEVEHSALSAYLAHACAQYPSLGGHALLHSSVSFDMAVTTIYGPLLSSGSIALTDLTGEAARSGTVPSGARRPTFLKVTPSHLALLAALPAQYSPTEQLIVGGEALTSAALDGWRAANPAVTVVNEYGPTEAAVGCCVHHVRPGEPVTGTSVPIGRPTDGTRLYVLDRNLDPVPSGAIGELYIAGAQLARGYLGRPDLTAASFVPDPFGPPATRMYRTGDLVRTREDGELEFLGRADEQLKINGYRVEPGEIEAALRGVAGVRQAAVVPRADASGGRSLTAYVVPDPGCTLDAEELRAHLSAQLPAHLVPAGFVMLPELPLTPNGKLDLAALPAAQPTSRSAHIAARTEHEELLCRLIGEVTGAARVGIDDDFVALGGTSIAAARLVTRARRAGLPLGLIDVLQKRTVRELLVDD